MLHPHTTSSHTLPTLTLSPLSNPHLDKPQSTVAGVSCTLMSPSQLPLECCSAPAALSPELSLPPVAVETTHQLLLAEIQPALVLLGRHCVTGLPAGGEYVWGVCVGRVCGECVWGECVGEREWEV